MKTVNKIVISIAAVFGLGLTIASVHAQQGSRVEWVLWGITWSQG